MEATEVREWEGLPSNTREKVQEETCYIIIIIIFLNHPQGFVPCGTTHWQRKETTAQSSDKHGGLKVGNAGGDDRNSFGLQSSDVASSLS